MRPCRLRHFRIRVRLAETVEIKPPDVKAGSTQGVAPGSSAEAVRDRECRRKRPAMDIEDRAAERSCVPPGRAGSAGTTTGHRRGSGSGNAGVDGPLRHRMCQAEKV